jgi:hypothetical protein
MSRTTNPLTPEQARLRAQVANARRWSRVPLAERPSQTQAARDALWRKYLDRVDPDGVLPQDERAALARQARRADMMARALKGSRARSAKLAAARKGAARKGAGDDRAA